jgi:hypothetical protein
MSNYPELFTTLKNVKVYPHRKLNYIITEDGKQPIDIRFTYCGRKYTPGTDQYQDSLLSAKVPTYTKLQIPWSIKNKDLAKKIMEDAGYRKIVLVSAPYEPFGREDEWGKELRVNHNSFNTIFNDSKVKENCYIIQIGNKFALHKVSCNMDLIDKTSVSDLMDLVSISDVCVSQIGNMLPMSEALNTKNFIVYSSSGLKSENKFIAAITPEKTVHYRKLNTSVIDTDSNILKRFYDTVGI